MNDLLPGFFATQLNVEVAYDDMDSLRETLQTANQEWAGGIREEWAALLRSRSMDAGSYCSLTAIEFDDDDSLYAYLQGLFDYLFEGAAGYPAPAE